ncbi:MAG: FecR family protein [Marinifilaceae bacterium]|jgi:ferric-dicitrate binding protein FerR (iron transport regulator)|nr:FecR family protein [Marinifilaceae bacterium]
MSLYLSKIKRIILKSLNNDLEQGDRVELDSWLESSSENQKLYNSIRNYENLENHITLSKSISYDKALLRNKEIRKQIKNRSRRINIMKYAASIILILSVAFGIKKLDLFNHPEEKILAGTTKAKLILSDGNEIHLGGEHNSKTYAEDGEAKIEIENNKIKYKSSSKAKTEIAYNKIIVPRGGEFYLELPDGTKMWINSESEISYPTSFESHTREIKMKGEIFLEVAHDKFKPFIVNTKHGAIKVLGTSFNVRDYDDENTFATTLVEGKVRLKLEDEDYDLSPGKQLKYSQNSKTVNIKSVNTNIYTAWCRSRFAFSNARLEDILNDMARWYDIEVKFENPTDKDILFTGNIKRYEKFESVIYMLELMQKAKFEIKGKQLIIKH